MLSKKYAPAGFALVFVCGLVTLFAALKFTVSAPEKASAIPADGGGYVMLSVDVEYSDRAIGEALSGAGIDAYISESASWVFLDDFEGLKQVALDRYDEAVESFDPRNDGYAERLRSFFVKDGKRRFFIGLGSSSATGTLNYSQIKRRIGAALRAETAFTLDAFVNPRRGTEVPLFFLFLSALGGALAVALKSPGASPRFFFRLILALIPVQLALALSGPGGFVCAAALFGCFECLLPPLRENVICFRRSGQRFKFDRIFRMNWLSALFFFLVYIAASLAAPVHPLPAVLAGVASFAAFVFFLWIEIWIEPRTKPDLEREPHRCFSPVPIRQPSFTLASLPLMTLPFAFASFLSLFLPLLGPPAANPAALPPALDIPAKEEYEAHFAFQSSFSLRPLDRRFGEPGRTDGAFYFDYSLGGDGLIADSRETTNPVMEEYPEIPPFPLEGLRAFLENGGNQADGGNGAGETGAAVIALLLALSACFARGRERRKTGNLFVFDIKRDKAVA